MQGGHNRKPTELKIIHGTARKDRMNPNEPKPEPMKDNSEPPYWVKGHLARKTWRTTYEKLKRLGILKETDEIAFEMLVSMYVRWRESAEKTDLDPYITPNGFQSAHPSVGIELKFAKELRTLLSEFGMTPSSRSRVSVGNEGEGNVDPMEDLLDAEG